MGKGSSGASPSVTSGLQSDANSLVAIAQNQANQSSQLFQTALPGYESASAFYSALASGDPYKIQQAIAPVSQQADTAAAGAKANILANGPAGGERNLALEQVDVNRGAQVGQAATQGYLGSFNALAQLGGQGISESQGAAGLGISGNSAASNSLSSLGGLQIQGQQLQAEQKGNSLGALSSLGSDAATLGGATIGAGATKGLTAALAA
jgi:hypothetical protein